MTLQKTQEKEMNESVVGRQGGGREIMRDNKGDNECNSKTKQKNPQIWGMSPGVIPEIPHPKS
jgi:hypothetical protein